MKFDYAAREATVWKDTELASALSDFFLWYPIVLMAIFHHSWWLVGAYVANFGMSQLVKRIIKRKRPDGSNWYSFYSGHTSSAFVAVALVPLAIIPALLVGYLRMAANKHWLTDVLVGAVVGLCFGGLAVWLR